MLLPPPDFAPIPGESGVTGTGVSKLVRTASKYRQFWQEEQGRSWSGKAFFYLNCVKWIRNRDKNIYIHSYISVSVLKPGRVMLRLLLNQVRKKEANYSLWILKTILLMNLCISTLSSVVFRISYCQVMDLVFSWTNLKFLHAAYALNCKWVLFCNTNIVISSGEDHRSTQTSLSTCSRKISGVLTVTFRGILFLCKMKLSDYKYPRNLRKQRREWLLSNHKVVLSEELISHHVSSERFNFLISNGLCSEKDFTNEIQQLASEAL